MISKEKVLELINIALAEGDLFLVDMSISSSNKIVVYIDGDKGVTLQDCINVSRAIEHNLDREAEDFELTVNSFGVGEPLRLKRQYKKNVGREIEVITNESSNKVVGELIGADENKIVVEIKAKKKKDVDEEREIAYEDIKEAKILISFK